MSPVIGDCSSMEIQEYTIPVQWGHIAVKAWGNRDDPPVLVAHGLQDNAGIFDRIMPLLPKCFYYMCIDLPSHGRSSSFPTQMLINPSDCVITYKLILDYLDRKKYIFLGHSWGAQTMVMFTQLYPEYVIKLCLIDGIYPFPLFEDEHRDFWMGRINGLIRINDSIIKKRQPCYTYEEAMSKLMESRMFGGITKLTAECLLKRCLTSAENGKFVFTTDPRLKVFLVTGCDEIFMAKIAKKYPIQCPMLLLKASLSKAKWERFQLLIEEVQKYPTCKIEELEGNHDDFSNQPEPWAAAISKFLCTENSKL